MSRVTTNYISFLSCIYNVGFLCQLLFDINWFILEYIINFIGKNLQILTCLLKLLASIFSLTFYCFCVIIFSLPFWWIKMNKSAPKLILSHKIPTKFLRRGYATPPGPYPARRLWRLDSAPSAFMSRRLGCVIFLIWPLVTFTNVGQYLLLFSMSKQVISPRRMRNAFGMPHRWPFRSFPVINRYRRPRQIIGSLWLPIYV